MKPLNTTRCPKCESVGFESYGEYVDNNQFPVTFIRCIKCKTAIGVMETKNISAMIMDLATKLGKPLNP